MTERRVVKRTARAILLDGTPQGRVSVLDDAAPDLILIKRTKPGEPPYWITPGGGVEPGQDATVVDALHREVDEELGAKVTDVVPAFVDTVPHDDPATGIPGSRPSPAVKSLAQEPLADPPGPDGTLPDSTRQGGAAASGPAWGGPAPEEPVQGVKVQHFFVCRLESMDLSRRHGPEVEQPCGAYEVVRIPFTREGIASVEMVPPTLRAYLDANIDGVLALLAHDFG
jgi:8-oxo-dGTP pyrophosphatase MutT (NUDIX family)